jgi:hypothetical protein
VKLRAKFITGGLLLTNEKGASQFVVAFADASSGLSLEQSYAISAQILALINRYGLEVPDHEAKRESDR